jgi:hypothetical protein
MIPSIEKLMNKKKKTGKRLQISKQRQKRNKRNENGSNGKNKNNNIKNEAALSYIVYILRRRKNCQPAAILVKNEERKV